MALTYHMFAPAWTAEKFRARVAAELDAVLLGAVKGRWEAFDTPERTAFQRFFNTRFDITHRLQAEAQLTGERTLVAELYLNANRHVPAGLDVRVTCPRPLPGPWTYWAEGGRCDGDPGLTEAFARDEALRRLGQRAVRLWWKGGSIQVRRPDARLEVSPTPDDGAVVLLASMPHERFLGFVTRLELGPFLQLLDLLAMVQ